MGVAHPATAALPTSRSTINALIIPAPREVQAFAAGLAATIHATASGATMGMVKHQNEKVT
jgi:hypothetical protein